MKEKTYQEQGIAFLLKAVIGLGSVYLITEKFVGQIDHLFHLESIRTALFIFHLIYFVLPIAIVCVYFFFKSDSVHLFPARTNLVLACIGAIYMIFIALAITIRVEPFLYIGGTLLLLTLCFLTWAMFKRNLRAYKKQALQYLALAFLVILFAFTYLIRNDKTAKSFETKYFSDLKGHFRVMDTVSNYLASTVNTFQPQTPVKLDSTILVRYFEKAGYDSALYKADLTELIRISRNRWGLYINLMSYKALLVLLPFAGLVLGILFLLSTSRSMPDERILLRKNSNDEYEVIDPPPAVIPEKEFLKIVFVILITLTIPVLHPLETIRSTFAKPVSFSEPTVPKKQGEEGDRSVKPTAFIITDTVKQFTMLGHGDVYFMKPGQSNPVNALHKQTLDSLKTALKNINDNVVLFSTFFGTERMGDDIPHNIAFRVGLVPGATSKDVKFYQRVRKLNSNVYKK